MADAERPPPDRSSRASGDYSEVGLDEVELIAKRKSRPGPDVDVGEQPWITFQPKSEHLKPAPPPLPEDGDISDEPTKVSGSDDPMSLDPPTLDPITRPRAREATSPDAPQTMEAKRAPA